MFRCFTKGAIRKVSRPFLIVPERLFSFALFLRIISPAPKQKKGLLPMKTKRSCLFAAAALFAAFALFTLLASTFDVKPIGPNGSPVGFATVNLQIFRLIGVHPLWLDITDWLGLLAIVFPFLFAILSSNLLS